MPARSVLGFPSYPSSLPQQHQQQHYTSTLSQPDFTKHYLQKKKTTTTTMAITRASKSTKTTTTTTKKPSLLSRLRNTHQAKVTTTQSTNPITGTTTTTQKTSTHPNGIGYKGHGGRGPLAGNRETHYVNTAGGGGAGTVKGTTTTHHHHNKRKPSVGDKVSGALMKLRGSVMGRRGVKVWFILLFFFFGKRGVC